MLDDVFSEFVFHISDQKKFRKVRVHEVVYILLHDLVIPENSILEVATQKFTEFFQF